MLSKILTPAQDELLKDERRILSRLRHAAEPLRRRGRTSGRRSTARSSSSTSSSSSSSSASSTPARARSSMRCSAAGCSPKGSRRPPRRSTCSSTATPSSGTVREPDLHVITAPAPLLREIHIVDTPGTNAIIREHEAITAEFVPRSDLVLFVTSADRPFTETERAFLEQVRGWGKKVVIVINKVDILDERARSVEEVRAFVAEQRAGAARLQPRDLSGQRAAGAARQAGRAGGCGRRAVRGARALHRDDARRARARAAEAAQPARRRRVARRAPRRVRQGAARRCCKDDFATLDEVERQLAVYQQDMIRDFEFRMSRHRQHPARDGAAAATSTSTTRCASAGSWICSTAAACSRGSSSRWSPTRRSRSSARSAS